MKFLTSNEAAYRLARTILQGLVGVLIANLDLLIGYVVLDPTQRAIIVAVVMAILSPIMAMLGEQGSKKEE
jgi:hypothetical protein